jgi:hypothetical protein
MLDGMADDSTNRGVQAGAIAATGHQTDRLDFFLGHARISLGQPSAREVAV